MYTFRVMFPCSSLSWCPSNFRSASSKSFKRAFLCSHSWLKIARIAYFNAVCLKSSKHAISKSEIISGYRFPKLTIWISLYFVFVVVVGCYCCFVVCKVLFHVLAEVEDILVSFGCNYYYNNFYYYFNNCCC